MSKNEQKIEKLRFDKKDLERLARLRLLDDDFMTKVFEDKECAEILLQIILERKDLKVLRVQVQYTVKNLKGRSVRLDILAVDETGKIYDIEVQRDVKVLEQSVPDTTAACWMLISRSQERNSKSCRRRM